VTIVSPSRQTADPLPVTASPSRQTASIKPSRNLAFSARYPCQPYWAV
jgi:hypothetical protein